MAGDEQPLVPPEQQTSCHAYYSCEHIAKLFPDADLSPPVNDEMQHCCVLGRR